MINTISKIANWFIQAGRSLSSLGKALFLSRKSTVSFKNKNKPLLVLGNGPSIKTQFEEIEKHRDQFDLLCVNNFTNTEHYTNLKPDYFLILSEEFWNNEKTIDANKQTRYDIIDSFVAKTNWPVVFFTPVKSKERKDFIEKIDSNKNITTVFFNTTPIEGLSNFCFWCFRNNIGMPRPHNVLIPSLIISINSGYSSIFLFGADHSWLPEISVDENNNALISQKHFYESVMDEKSRMYKQGRNPRKLHEILYKFMVSFKAYHTIRGYAERRNVNIYNCTEKSFIDAFDRKKSTEVLKKSN